MQEGVEGRGPRLLQEEGRPVQVRAHRRPRGRYDHLLYQRRLHRPLPRTPCQACRRHQGRQADGDRRRILERRPEPQPAHPHIRSKLPQEEHARRVSPDDGGGQEEGPPQARQGDGTVHVLEPRRTRTPDVAAPRRRDAQRARELPAQEAGRARISARRDSAHRKQGTLRDFGTLCKVRQGFVPAHPYAAGRRGVHAQTHELPSPLRDIPQLPPLLQGPSAPFRGVRNGLPL